MVSVALGVTACSSTPTPTMDAGGELPGDVPAADQRGQDAADVPVTPPANTPVAMFQYDAQRSGANRTERRLSPAALMAGNFGPDAAFAPTLDGAVYAQPLYLPGLMVMGARHDVLFVGTQNNTMYALDAATGATLWHVNLGTPVPLRSQPCGNISPATGILGTPVIDVAAGTLYAVSYATTDGGTTKVFSLNGFDVTTGQQRTGYPAVIQPPDNNGVSFDPNPQGERGALALVDGKVYVPFGGLYGDCGHYHGWVVGISTTNPTQQVSFATPGNGSGIWAVGGVSADGAGHTFVATGNGFTGASMGERVIRLGAGATGPTFASGTSEFFAPSDRSSLDAADADIGSIAPMLLADHTGSSTPHLIFQSGKAGVAYLVNRDNLGGNGTGDGTNGEGVYSDQIYSGGVYGAAATWTGGGSTYVFVPGRGTQAMPCTGSGGVMALQLGLDMGNSTFSAIWCTTGLTEATSPVVSSNGDNDAILWVGGVTPTALQAYQVSTGMQLYASSGASAPSRVRHWVPPIVADGRVFVTGSNTVTMYRVH